MCTFVDDVRKLTDKQRSDVQRAFLGLHSPYIVREVYWDRVKATEILDATPEERRRILNSVKVIVDPTRYKQVLSYRTTPMLPCVFFRGRRGVRWRPPMHVRNHNDNCYWYWWWLCNSSGHCWSGRTSPRKPRRVFNSGMLGESSGHFHQKRHKRSCAEGGQSANWHMSRISRGYILREEQLCFQTAYRPKSTRFTRWEFLRQRMSRICVPKNMCSYCCRC